MQLYYIKNRWINESSMYTQVEADRIIGRRKQIALVAGEVDNIYHLRVIATLRSFPRIVWLKPEIVKSNDEGFLDLQESRILSWIECAWSAYREALHLPMDAREVADWYDAFEERTIEDKMVVKESDYETIFSQLRWDDIIFFTSFNKFPVREPSYFSKLKVVKQTRYFSVYHSSDQLYIYLDYLNWTNTLERDFEQRIALRLTILKLHSQVSR